MNYRLAKRPDPWIALTVFGLVLFGIVMIYSASIIIGHTDYGDDRYFVKSQFKAAILGFSAMIVMANIDYHKWKRWAGWMLGITYLLLISVFFFSKGEVNGAHRWILIAGQSFQPSEFAKLTFVIYISAWLAGKKDRLGDILGTFLPYLLVMGGIAVLMLMQPDFGTLTIILAPAIAIYFVAGLTWQQVLLSFGVIGLSVVAVLAGPHGQYRRERISTFLHPTQDVQGRDYHINNITIAIGSGGWQGLGFGESKQKRLFLPEPHTDSIFAIISEELGSVRSFLLILVYGFLIYRGLRIAAAADDLFGRYLAVGITTWFGFQAFINFGSMLQFVPLVGVPLPFVSYGGTNLLISLAAIGLLLNVSRYVDMEPVVALGKQKNNRKHGRA